MDAAVHSGFSWGYVVETHCVHVLQCCCGYCRVWKGCILRFEMHTSLLSLSKSWKLAAELTTCSADLRQFGKELRNASVERKGHVCMYNLPGTAFAVCEGRTRLRFWSPSSRK